MNEPSCMKKPFMKCRVRPTHAVLLIGDVADDHHRLRPAPRREDHQGLLQPDAAARQGGIRMLEPMVVLTYITDQQNRMVGRTQHFMNGFYMQDGSFINVIYQRNLDVLDVPFRIPQTTVTIPVGTYKFDEADAHLQHQPGASGSTSGSPTSRCSSTAAPSRR